MAKVEARFFDPATGSEYRKMVDEECEPYPWQELSDELVERTAERYGVTKERAHRALEAFRRELYDGATRCTQRPPTDPGGCTVLRPFGPSDYCESCGRDPGRFKDRSYARILPADSDDPGQCFLTLCSSCLRSIADRVERDQ